jgi:hypothetical protein
VSFMSRSRAGEESVRGEPWASGSKLLVQHA